jgi:hypothetical protein
MKLWILIFITSLLPKAVFPADLKGEWVLEKSALTYTVTHPLHIVHGKSLSAKGKGVCYSHNCQFLVGVRVDSFDSGDKNRDYHMLEVTRAGTYPLIKVQVEMPEGMPKTAPKQMIVDAVVEFAGKKATYGKVKLDIIEWKPGVVHLTGLLPLTLKDFDIPAPALLTMPIQNEIPVKMEMFWKHASQNNEVTKNEKR